MVHDYLELNSEFSILLLHFLSSLLIVEACAKLLYETIRIGILQKDVNIVAFINIMDGRESVPAKKTTRKRAGSVKKGKKGAPKPKKEVHNSADISDDETLTVPEPVSKPVPEPAPEPVPEDEHHAWVIQDIQQHDHKRRQDLQVIPEAQLGVDYILTKLKFEDIKFKNGKTDFLDLLVYLLFAWGFPSRVMPVLLDELQCMTRSELDVTRAREVLHDIGCVETSAIGDDKWSKVNYIIEKAKNLCLIRCPVTPVADVSTHRLDFEAFTYLMKGIYSEEKLVKQHVFFKSESDFDVSVNGMEFEPIEKTESWIIYRLLWAIGDDAVYVNMAAQYGEEDAIFRFDRSENQRPIAIGHVDTVNRVQFCCFKAVKCYSRYAKLQE